MEEDIAHPAGLVMSVNDYLINEFKGGLGGRGKENEIHINLTIVNTGNRTFSISPLKDFSVELRHTYPAIEDSLGKATRHSFAVHPGTQSRVNLYFRVPAEETLAPLLIFTLEGSKVRVLCDKEMNRMASKMKNTGLTTDESIKLAGFFLDAGRIAMARNVVGPALAKDPYNSNLLIQMASIEDRSGYPKTASEFLQRVNPANIRTRKESISFAVQAFELGNYKLAINVLEPLASINQLDEDAKVYLARAYYYEDEFNQSEELLNNLIRNGSRDKLVFFTLGNIKDKTNKIEQAIANWKKAVELDPDYCEAYFNLGVAYLKKNDTIKAREYWKKVLLLKPDSATLSATEEALSATEY